ncbi:MAG TPA: ATP-dependent DNA helicase RecG [Desulfobacteraceae bacterium]|nr:ATP-dependent DNA helicase RecG [Desulfobacteraceae bacterium]HPJ68666.1 ATP-dependent DNA helicase RecG [Desulfobacteraceae bacterium]HPQ29305.1 ATP-dependent DNA helicase RecG [Desulfobacteraceae bacterium]
MNLTQIKYLEKSPNLNQPLTSIKGIGPKRAAFLSEKGICSLLDLILFMPVRYEDRTQIMPINKTQEGLAALIKGNVVSGREQRFYLSGKGLFRVIIKDEATELDLLWFQYNKAFLSRFCRKNLEIVAYGVIRNKNGRRQMIHPDIIIVDEHQDQQILGLFPVYPLIRGVSMQVIRSAIRQVIYRYQGNIIDSIPREITQRLELPDLAEAIRCIHIPPEDSSVDQFVNHKTKYHRRLTFEKVFHMMLNIIYRKNSRESRIRTPFRIEKGIIDKLKKCFPFQLTGDQARVIEEIFEDLKKARPMNRLVQGDVGCGKTVVAAAAAYSAIQNNYQAAIMVPTQVLALQHYEYFLGIPDFMGFRVVLLTGALSKFERLEVYEKIRKGDYNLIIGTHALIQKDLSFKNLGLIVIDEQQRFGVNQRALFDEKGTNPHLLVMTGTPIPRTIALTLYADMDISVIKEFPPGHLPVKTLLAKDGDKRKVYNLIRERISNGQQAIIVCPVIELSEDTGLKNVLEMHEKLVKLFVPPLSVRLIHGRMAAYEKDRIMAEFRKGQIDLLVGTSVIEVGVHAPGVTIMVVEDPERFGLAQLHQLRGRVGRGLKGGLFILMLKKDLSEKSISRLKMLVEIEDGFELAQKDLEMRGQGEIAGIRQAGHGELDLMDIYDEPDLLINAKREAERIIASDPGLLSSENSILRERMSGFNLI